MPRRVPPQGSAPIGAQTTSQRPMKAAATAVIHTTLRSNSNTAAAGAVAKMKKQSKNPTVALAAPVAQSACAMVNTPPTVDLARVRADLLAIDRRDATTASRRDEEGEPLWDPVVVFESISREDFREWLDENDGELRRWWYEPIDEDTGRVLVYSLPSDVHEAASGAVLSSILAELIEDGGKNVLQTLELKPSPRCELKDRDQEPDMTLTPMACLKGKFPNVVVEIEYKNLTADQLEEKLVRWMGKETTVQVAIGIKIYKGSKNYVAILHVRDEYKAEIEALHEKAEVQKPTWPQYLSFGEDHETPRPLQFPLRALYYGTEMPLSLRSHQQDMISIDLLALRRHIDARLDIEADQKEEKKRRAEDSSPPAEPATKKPRQFNMKDVDKELAIIEESTAANAVGEDDEGETLWEPVVVCDHISRGAFRDWLSKNRGKLQRWWYEPNDQGAQDSDRVVVYNRENATVTSMANRVITDIAIEVGRVGGRSVSGTLQTEARPICELPDRDQEALMSLTPMQLHGTNHFPNLVVEVEGRNVSLSMLEEKLTRWMWPETTVQVAIGVKINEKSDIHVGILLLRGVDEPQIVLFGKEVKDPSPLTFPLEALYRGTTMPDSLSGHEQDIIHIDLVYRGQPHG